MQEFIFGELEAEVGGYFVCAVWRNKYNFQLELTCWESWNFKELPQIKTWPKNLPIHKLAKVSAILTWTPGWQLVRAEASRHQLCTVKLHFLSTLVFNFQLSTSVVATIDQGTKPLQLKGASSKNITYGQNWRECLENWSQRMISYISRPVVARWGWQGSLWRHWHWGWGWAEGGDCGGQGEEREQQQLQHGAALPARPGGQDRLPLPLVRAADLGGCQV